MSLAWVEAGVQAGCLVVAVAITVLYHLFLTHQKKVEAGELEKNPYDWLVEFAFWSGVLQTVVYTVILAITVKRAATEKS